MTCGYALSDAELHTAGVLHLKVKSPDHNLHFEIPVLDCPAARCIERDDSICWTATHVFWSNRARTVRDVKIARHGAGVHGVAGLDEKKGPPWKNEPHNEHEDWESGEEHA